VNATGALVSLFATSFVIALSGAMMPGPVLAMVVSETPRRGAFTGTRVMAGHFVLEAVLMAGLVLGLSTVLHNPTVIGVIAFAGGAMLLWMGQGMIRSVRRLTLAVEGGTARSTNLLLAGITTSLSNPYWLLWWATIGLGYLVVGMRHGLPGVLAFFFGHTLADVAWYTFVSAGLTLGRRFMSDKVYRGLVATCGLALIYFGAVFFASGVEGLLLRS
jgi:threonine/homoserine/homoserine lactone efflux protein